jgi:hypothetical protein
VRVHYADYSTKTNEARHGKNAAQQIAEALVLLECGEMKLMHALPTEALMSREDIARIEREFGGP